MINALIRDGIFALDEKVRERERRSRHTFAGTSKSSNTQISIKFIAQFGSLRNQRYISLVYDYYRPDKSHAWKNQEVIYKSRTPVMNEGY